MKDKICSVWYEYLEIKLILFIYNYRNIEIQKDIFSVGKVIILIVIVSCLMSSWANKRIKPLC